MKSAVEPGLAAALLSDHFFLFPKFNSLNRISDNMPIIKLDVSDEQICTVLAKFF